jgi:hypothetical protein
VLPLPPWLVVDGGFNSVIESTIDHDQIEVLLVTVFASTFSSYSFPGGMTN